MALYPCLTRRPRVTLTQPLNADIHVLIHYVIWRTPDVLNEKVQCFLNLYGKTWHDACSPAGP
jgi:hypothetical protein